MKLVQLTAPRIYDVAFILLHDFITKHVFYAYVFAVGFKELLRSEALSFRLNASLGELCEPQSIFPTQFNGQGFLIRDYIRDYTKLQEGPLCPQ